MFIDTTYAMAYISGVFISQVLDPKGNIKQYPRGKELGLFSFEVCHKRHALHENSHKAAEVGAAIILDH